MVKDLEFRRMFNQPADPSNCFLDLQAGAGGAGEPGEKEWPQPGSSHSCLPCRRASATAGRSTQSATEGVFLRKFARECAIAVLVAAAHPTFAQDSFRQTVVVTGAARPVELGSVTRAMTIITRDLPCASRSRLAPVAIAMAGRAYFAAALALSAALLVLALQGARDPSPRRARRLSLRREDLDARFPGLLDAVLSAEDSKPKA